MLRSLKYVLFAITLLTSVRSAAQDTDRHKVIDSLKQAFTNARHDTARCSAGLLLFSEIYATRPDTAFIIGKKIKEIAEKGIATDPLNKKVYQKYLASALNNLGYLIKNKGQIATALEYYINGLKLQEEIGDLDGAATSFFNIAVIYDNQLENAEALEYYNKAMGTFEKTKDSTSMAYVLNNLGVAYSNAGQDQKAMESFHMALNIFNRTNNQFGKSYLFSSMGVIYEKKKMYAQALENYKECLKIYEEAGDKQGVSFSLNNIGVNYYRQKKYREALKYGQKSYELSQTIGYVENLRNNAELLSQVYKETRDYKNALRFYEMYVHLNDSLNNETTRKASIKSQLKYEYEKQAAADSVAHAKESEIKNAQLAKQTAEIKAKKNQQYALFGGLGLVMIFAGFMYNRFKVTQKQKSIIEHQKEEVEEQKKLVEEKQKEILDSIHYARRIQLAQIPSEKRVATLLARLRT